ncbi:MAG: DHHW family protein [Eubacteriales bacterium]
MRNKIVTGTFCLLLACGIISGILTPDKYYSESEKRTLTQKNAVSAAVLPSGKIGREIEKYLSDQFPLRDGWITVKTITERLSGKTEINGVYFGRDGYLIDRFVSFDRKQFEANLKALKKLSETICVPMNVMLVPTAAQILSEKLPPWAPNLDQKALFDEATAAGLDTVDVFQILSEHSSEYIFYRTDHHFTSLGAYYCYAVWLQMQGKTAKPISAWQSQVLCSNFRGTTYNRVNCPFTGYDTIEAFYKTLQHTVNYNNGDYVTDSIYERKFLSGKDQYAAFLNSNQAVTVVSGSGEGRLLIIKDSYANCFAQFVIDGCEETHLIDPRFFRGSVSGYIEENGITQVLVLYNIPNFVSDTALAGTVR